MACTAGDGLPGGPRGTFPIRTEGIRIPTVELEEETIEQIDRLRVDDESYDELVNELVNIYETSEYTLFRAGD